ncbi:MAG: hypothetical protein QF773_00255 [Lentisphaeria bacterium]|nr:hypothetical protein [Lentisphaeria bacterium]
MNHSLQRLLLICPLTILLLPAARTADQRAIDNFKQRFPTFRDCTEYTVQAVDYEIDSTRRLWKISTRESVDDLTKGRRAVILHDVDHSTIAIVAGDIYEAMRTRLDIVVTDPGIPPEPGDQLLVAPLPEYHNMVERLSKAMIKIPTQFEISTRDIFFAAWKTAYDTAAGAAAVKQDMPAAQAAEVEAAQQRLQEIKREAVDRCSEKLPRLRQACVRTLTTENLDAYDDYVTETSDFVKGFGSAEGADFAAARDWVKAARKLLSAKQLLKKHPVLSDNLPNDFRTFLTQAADINEQSASLAELFKVHGLEADGLAVADEAFIEQTANRLLDSIEQAKQNYLADKSGGVSRLERERLKSMDNWMMQRDANDVLRARWKQLGNWVAEVDASQSDELKVLKLIDRWQTDSGISLEVFTMSSDRRLLATIRQRLKEPLSETIETKSIQLSGLFQLFIDLDNTRKQWEETGDVEAFAAASRQGKNSIAKLTAFSNWRPYVAERCRQAENFVSRTNEFHNSLTTYEVPDKFETEPARNAAVAAVERLSVGSIESPAAEAQAAQAVRQLVASLQNRPIIPTLVVEPPDDWQEILGNVEEFVQQALTAVDRDDSLTLIGRAEKGLDKCVNLGMPRDERYSQLSLSLLSTKLKHHHRRQTSYKAILAAARALLQAAPGQTLPQILLGQEWTSTEVAALVLSQTNSSINIVEFEYASPEQRANFSDSDRDLYRRMPLRLVVLLENGTPGEWQNKSALQLVALGTFNSTYELRLIPGIDDKPLFYIGVQEITNRQFKPFAPFIGQQAGAPDAIVAEFIYPTAAAFCNWLNMKYGLRNGAHQRLPYTCSLGDRPRDWGGKKRDWRRQADSSGMRLPDRDEWQRAMVYSEHAGLQNMSGGVAELIDFGNPAMEYFFDIQGKLKKTVGREYGSPSGGLQGCRLLLPSKEE